MTKSELPIPIFRLALLLAYLYEIFINEKRCEQNFKYTEWYLTQNYSTNEIELMLKFLREAGLKCDCDIIKKLDLRELLDNKFIFHE